MKAALAILVLVGCGAPAEPATPAETTTVMVDEFTLRDIRQHAARVLRCQGPAVDVQVTQWAGSQGMVQAAGCGFGITYYVVCETRGRCGWTLAE